MLKILRIAAVISSLVAGSAAMAEEAIFHSLPQYLKVDSESAIFPGMQGIEDVFDDVDVGSGLAGTKEVKLLRIHDVEEVEGNAKTKDFWLLEGKGSLVEVIPKFPVKTLLVDEFMPLLKLLGDIDHYGSATMCRFAPAVAILIGGAEPDFVVLVCFSCHDARVIRRPTKKHPMPHESNVGMSPELEQMVLALARKAFADDAELKGLQLKERKRSDKLPLLNLGAPLPMK